MSSPKNSKQPRFLVTFHFFSVGPSRTARREGEMICSDLSGHVKKKAGGPPSWRIIPGLGYVVNDHGDRKSPKSGCGSPSKWPNSMAYKWG